MKKILILSTLMLNLFFITGCVDTDITLDIDKKGNMTLYSDILIKDTYFEDLSKEELDKLKQDYNSIEKITSPGKSGYRVTEDLGNLRSTKASNIKNIKSIEELKDMLDIKIEKNTFYNIYDVKLNIKDYMLANKGSIESIENNKTMLSAIGSSSSINFNLRLPIELIENNATTISENNGKYIYSWNYTLKSMDNIHIKAKSYNVNNIVLISIGVIVIVGIVIYTVLKKRKNKMD